MSHAGGGSRAIAISSSRPPFEQADVNATSICGHFSSGGFQAAGGTLGQLQDQKSRIAMRLAKHAVDALGRSDCPSCCLSKPPGPSNRAVIVSPQDRPERPDFWDAATHHAAPAIFSGMTRLVSRAKFLHILFSYLLAGYIFIFLILQRFKISSFIYNFYNFTRI